MTPTETITSNENEEQQPPPQHPGTLSSARHWTRLGFHVVPIHRTELKQPVEKGWQFCRYREDELAAHFKSEHNVGILLGTSEKHAADVDMDCWQAIQAGRILLPTTGLRWGRDGKPASHAMYIVDPMSKTKQYKDPLDDNAVLVEFRCHAANGKPMQTVAPYGLHAKSGEEIRFELGTTSVATKMRGEDLKNHVALVAAAAIFAKYYPEHARNETECAIAGVLARSEWEVEDAVSFVSAIYAGAPMNDTNTSGQGLNPTGDNSVRSTFEKFAKGEEISGIPTLRKCFGDKAEAVDCALEWLAIKLEDVELIGPEDIKPFGEYNIPPANYVIDRFLIENTTEILVGPSGSGKSVLATAMGDAVAHGQPFCGLPTKKRPVLIVDRGENPSSVMEHRLKMLGIGNQKNDPDFVRIWGDWAEQLPSMPSARITKWVESCDPKPLIIVDCLGVFFEGKSENDSAEMRKFMKLPADWEKLGATLIIIHNKGKDAAIAYRGASAIKDACDAMRVVDSQFNENLLASMVITTEKNRMVREGSLPKVFGLEFKDGVGFKLMDRLPEREAKKLARKDIMELLQDHPGCDAREFDELAASRKITSRDKAREILSEGIREQWVRREKDGKGFKHWYQDPPPPPNTDEVPF